jgi:hypothetical protein
MKRERDEENIEELLDECYRRNLIYDHVDLSEEEQEIVRSVVSLNSNPHTGWGWGTATGHINFEEAVNAGGKYNSIYAVTNYTDALFKFLSRFDDNDYALAKNDLFDKLTRDPINMEDYPTKQDATEEFLNVFLNTGKNRDMLNKLAQYNDYAKNKQKYSLTFAALVAAARAFNALSEREFDQAYKIFRNMSKRIECQIIKDRAYNEEELSGSYGGKSRRTKRKPRRTKRKPRKPRKRTRRSRRRSCRRSCRRSRRRSRQRSRRRSH